MAALPQRRLALAALLAGSALAVTATLIVVQTSRSPAPAPAPVPVPAPVPDPASPPTPPPIAPPAPSVHSPAPTESESSLASEIRSLVAAGQIGKARSRANAYFEQFPYGPSEAELERLTGAHPRRDATDTRP